MLTAREIMTTNTVTISPEAGIADAVKILLERHFNGLPVVDAEGNLLGLICQSDLVAQQKKLDLPSIFSLLDGYALFGASRTERDLDKITALTVGQAMTTKLITGTPDTPLEDLATLMVKNKYYTVPIVVNGKVVGIVGKEDILRTLIHDL